MATPVTPTPRQGSWVKMDEWDGSDYQDQPRQGSWVKMDPHIAPWTPQARQGSWVRMDPVEVKLKVKIDGIFGWSEANIKTDGEFVPGELEEML